MRPQGGLFIEFVTVRDYVKLFFQQFAKPNDNFYGYRDSALKDSWPHKAVLMDLAVPTGHFPVVL